MRTTTLAATSSTLFNDTVNNYQDEQSERWIEEWMIGRQNRDLLVVSTNYKLSKVHIVNDSGNHRKSLNLSIAASLKKLQTSYIDILSPTLVVESPRRNLSLLRPVSDNLQDWSTSIEELMDSLHILVEQGLDSRWNVMLRYLEREVIPMALAPYDVISGGKFQSQAQIKEREKTGEDLRTMLGTGQSP
ncbi:uncharacterized protein PV07_04792 [Cladophialophora immunda]|uniref:NADP-dependent oxidoreductase domain-containing protein n=1 Tax=Cladophialophora immunda TaxID=569365 RepID=A0A0D2CFE0_9EURO|nr:uncharacterized protein PV07_04792 [Cladophialophora immunda]KIW28940.1 hypothetical protein PV07_04792 [Cladophialophora immunda]